MNRLGMIKGTADKYQHQLYDRFIWLYAEDEGVKKGIFYPNIKVGDVVTEGELLGELKDYFGHPLSKVKSPADGKVLFLVTSPAISEKKRGLLMGIASR